LTSRASKGCAYCGSADRPLTREHIWGETFHDLHPPHTNFSAKLPESGVKKDPVIKDVCDICNNKRLSPLDKYGVELTKRYFLPSGNGVDPPVHFEYQSFETFSRWVLKLLYNDARACGQQVEEHAAFRHYILGDAAPTRNLNVFGGLLRPARVPKEFIDGIGRKIIYPRDNTMSILVPQEVAPEYRDKLMLGREIRFSAFIFWIMVWKDDVELDTRREIQQVIVRQYQCKHIHPRRSYVNLHYTNIDTFRLLIDSHQNDFESVKSFVTTN
jgi:hypothetical protein